MALHAVWRLFIGCRFLFGKSYHTLTFKPKLFIFDRNYFLAFFVNISNFSIYVKPYFFINNRYYLFSQFIYKIKIFVILFFRFCLQRTVLVWFVVDKFNYYFPLINYFFKFLQTWRKL